METTFFDDNLYLHFTTALFASVINLLIIQPLDVLKTLAMTSYSKESCSVFSDILIQVSKLGFFGLYKGLTPGLMRSGPSHVLTFIFLEQLRLKFGYVVAV